MLLKDMTEDWSLSEKYPGYAVKYLKYKNGTIEAYRPILDEEEQARRERHILDTMESIMRSELLQEGRPA